jgi:hypothetical protein
MSTQVAGHRRLAAACLLLLVENAIFGSTMGY